MAHDEWYTPKEIIEPIREFYGGTIDLDPASCFEANKTIKANAYFVESHQGLNHRWKGSIWCNPPYCDGATQEWVFNVAKKYLAEESSIECAIVLVNRSDAKWYYDFLDNHEGGYYQFRKRIKFINGQPESDKPSSPRYNNDLIYWGKNPLGFQLMCKRAFGKPVPSSR
jgi:hypothetical protein